MQRCRKNPVSWLVAVVLAVASTTCQALSCHHWRPAASNVLNRGVPLSASAGSTNGRPTTKTRRARDLIQGLIQEDKCFSSDEGARAFGDVCALNIVYEDRFEPQPIVGKREVTQHLLNKVAQRKGRGEVRLDKISDGDQACGFAWTWTSGSEEGLRGTTFVELNEQGEIQFVAEIPEPIYKPGDLTLELLKTLTADEEWGTFEPIQPKTPTIANEVVKYIFTGRPNADPEEALEDVMRFWNDDIVYRDFQYPEVMRGPAEVRKFASDFSLPGVVFRPLRFDDGIDSTCFTWECAISDAPDTVKGISFYELDKDTRKVKYVRDVAESAIKPPFFGKLARDLRPGLGVFQGSKLGSRPGGL